jgi:hypothetical protein
LLVADRDVAVIGRLKGAAAMFHATWCDMSLGKGVADRAAADIPAIRIEFIELLLRAPDHTARSPGSHLVAPAVFVNDSNAGYRTAELMQVTGL